MYMLNDQTGSGAHPALCSVGTGVLSPGVQRPGRKINDSPPYVTEVKNEWSSASPRPVCFLGVDE